MARLVRLAALCPTPTSPRHPTSWSRTRRPTARSECHSRRDRSSNCPRRLRRPSCQSLSARIRYPYSGSKTCCQGRTAVGLRMITGAPGHHGAYDIGDQPVFRPIPPTNDIARTDSGDCDVCTAPVRPVKERAADMRPSPVPRSPCCWSKDHGRRVFRSRDSPRSTHGSA